MKKTFLSIFFIIGLIGLLVGWYFFLRSNTSFEENKKYLYIHSGSNYEELLTQCKESTLIERFGDFKQMADWMDLETHVHPGKYAIQSGMSSYAMVRMLRGGKQEAVKVVINKLRTPEDFYAKLDGYLEPDSISFARYFQSPEFLQPFHLDTQKIQCLILPNTYSMFWNSSVEKVAEKLSREYDKFWSEERRAKARKLGLQLWEVTTLASIVEEETLKKEDKPKIASTYLNRLKIGMPLQADPTLKYGIRNFGLRRILRVHTQISSSYNTYTNRGLPPGPICTPSAESVDAVLNAPTTNYLFFCAREDFSGYSNFAATLQEHEINAQNYQAALNARGIK